MADVTVSQLADTIGTPDDRLLQQLQEAGLPQKAVVDLISEEEKQTLLNHIKKGHGDTEGAPKKITLKRRTISTLKTGGAGRGRTVNVEVRKKRTYVRKSEIEPKETKEKDVPVAIPVVQPTQQLADDEERRRRAHAELETEAENRREAAKKLEEETKKIEEDKEIEERKAKKALEAEAKKEKELEESKISSRKDKRDRHDLDETDTKEKRSKHGDRKRRVEELIDEEVEEILEVDEAEKVPAPLGLSSSRTKRKARSQGPRHKFTVPTGEIKRDVELGESITIAQLSQKMSVKATDVIKTLMGLGEMVSINESIDQETASMVVEEFGHRVKLVDADAVEKSLIEDEMKLEGERVTRSPVVTVMGHVDHGKTSLLDYIRHSNVVDGEAGGITQHIGAYRVNTDQGDICFIDTPGHAAFTAMRARGAKSTDIVILVVAADDGVMPQTEEAVQHAKAAGAPMVVAINKMDKEGADPERVKNELAAREVIPDSWGGDTQFVPVSAINGEGISELLEAVLLQAELLELTAVEQGPANGVVIESSLDKGRGTVATLLIQNGMLKQGDVVVAGQQFGRVRAINNDAGQLIKSAGPSTPVNILGLNSTPEAGEPFVVVKDEKRAREVAAFRRDKIAGERRSTQTTSLDTLLASFGSAEVNYLNIVVKADVRGSLEAIVSALNELGNDEVKVNVVFSGVGGIAEHDVNFAVTANAVVFGFNVRADPSARKRIEEENIDLRYYKVIYDLIDDVKDALSGMLSPEIREEIVGIAEVRDVFQSKKFGSIAGCIVTEGTVFRDKRIRVLRDNIVIFEGELESLRHFKDEVDDARNGTECGIGVKNYNDVKVGDQVEVFDTREVAREL